MEEHLRNYCTQMQGTCSACKSQITRSKLDDHLCQRSPEDIIKELLQQLDEAKSNSDTLEQKYQDERREKEMYDNLLH